MNQDYHYSATFLASRRAGFSEDDSDKIAWAALMVDEMSKEQYKDMNYPAYKAEITAYKYSEAIAVVFGLNHANIHCTASVEFNVDEKNFIGILEDTVKSEFDANAQLEREIWIAFHFLPGNLKLKGDQNKEGWEYRHKFEGTDPIRSFDKVWDEKDFACMCFPNSELAEEMVKDTREVFHKKPYSMEFKLMLLGIRMHVLADTWAHQDFTGSRNYWCNGVLDVEGADEGFLSRWFWWGDNHCLGYLGHAKLGHLPDQGYQKYSYKAQWRTQRVEVNNVDRFSNALAQMYNALKFIRDDKSSSPVKTENSCLSDLQKCDTCPDLYISQWNTFEEERKKSSTGNEMVKEMKELIDVAKGVLSHDPGTADGDQIKFWEEVLPISLNTYREAKKINKDLYDDYASAAAYHRKWVMREVNRRLKCINPEWTYFSEGQEWR